ncbi:MAG TPA: hypothetical protein VL361_26900 [Candidatus Limnocylindrales bacterium]|nr:hypothetical protein [Candidatus Limnocylindrales bacterium]
MEPTTQLGACLLLVGGVSLLILGALAGRKISGRKRWFVVVTCLLPAVTFVIIAALAWHKIREDARQSSKIFAAISPVSVLTGEEQRAFLLLSRSSPRIRDGVMKLAFANSSNAALALPRMEILLQSTLQLDSTGEGRNHLWNRIVEPVLRRKPAREVIMLSAATASIGGYDSNRVTAILQLLGPLIAQETNLEQRSIELGLFVPLVDFASADQIEPVANLLLSELLGEPNPMEANIKTGLLNPTGSRRVRDLRRLVSRFSEAPAQRFAERVIAALGTETNSSVALAMGKVLEEVKFELDPSQVARATTNLDRQLPRRQGGVMQDRAGPLTGLAEVMTPQQAANAMTLLLGVLRQEPDSWYHKELTRPFKPLAQRLSVEDVQRLAEPIAEVSPDTLELIRDRVPQEQAYLWTDRWMQKAIDIANPTRRRSQMPQVATLVARLTPERAAKLAEEVWQVFLNEPDWNRRSDEASFLVMLVPQLTDEVAASLARRVVEQMLQRRLDLPTLVTILTPLLPHCDPATLQEAVACVMKTYDRPRRGFGPTRLEQRAFLLGAGFTADEVERVLEPLVTAFENLEHAETYLDLVTSLRSLGDHLSREQNERVANRMVFLFTQKPNMIGLSLLSELATNITLTPYQAKRIADILLPSALECHMPDSDWIARWTGPFLTRLAAAQVEATGHEIISAMARMHEQMGAVLDARCLLQLTNVLQPDQARRLGDQLLQIPAQRGNHPGFASVMDTARSWGTPQQLAVSSSNYPGSAHLSASQQVHESVSDWALPWEFVEHQEKQCYKYRLEAWASSLAGMVDVMTRTNAGFVAEQVAARCAAQGELEPMLYDEDIARVLQYASDTSLNRILTTPFMVGGLRRMVVRACELKTGKSFQGDEWRMLGSTVRTNL